MNQNQNQNQNRTGTGIRNEEMKAMGWKEKEESGANRNGVIINFDHHRPNRPSQTGTPISLLSLEGWSNHHRIDHHRPFFHLRSLNCAHSFSHNIPLHKKDLVLSFPLVHWLPLVLWLVCYTIGSEGTGCCFSKVKVKLAEHDKLLKKFDHKEALVSALKGKNPENVVAVMEELVARKKLLRSAILIHQS
ncbi:hypothetical protein U1Q18_012697 [Sarracenia purpurea var. burkii]